MKKIIVAIVTMLAFASLSVVALPAQPAAATDYCGATDQGQVKTSINIGCAGKGEPVADMAFAIIRFLTNGAGLVIVGSIIYGGLQYTGSRGDPNSTAMAINRIRSSVVALLIFIFAFAILNYIIPRGFLFQ